MRARTPSRRVPALRASLASAATLALLVVGAEPLDAQIINVPITARVDGAPGTMIGNVVASSSGANITGTFAFGAGFAYLDDWYDFRWINVVTAYTVNGMPVDADMDGNPDDPVVGELPAIDPQVGQAVPGALPAGVGDDRPYYFNDANWAADAPPGTHVEGIQTRFIDARFDNPGPGNVSVISFNTFLVVDNLTDFTAWGQNQFCVLQGFSWSYSSATNSVTLGGPLAPDAGTINTALGNAAPAFTPPMGLGPWMAVRSCQLTACFSPFTPSYDFLPIPPNFLDILFSGNDITPGFLNLDDGGQVVPVGFPFWFYGVLNSQLGISTNGYLADDPLLFDFTNDCPLGNPGPPNRGIYPYWADLRLSEHGLVIVETMGSAPNRVFVAQWEDVGTFDTSAASITFQVQLHEQGSVIEFHYEQLQSGPGFDASGAEASVGIEDQGLTNTVEIACNTPGSLSPTTAFRIFAVASQTPRLGAPPNPGTWTPVGPPPTVGQPWQAVVSGALPAPALDFAILSTQPGVNVPSIFGTFLCSVSTPLLQLNPVPGTPIVVSVPADCSFLGFPVCTQGGSVSFGPLQLGLANALDLVIGAQ